MRLAPARDFAPRAPFVLHMSVPARGVQCKICRIINEPQGKFRPGGQVLSESQLLQDSGLELDDGRKMKFLGRRDWPGWFTARFENT